MPENSIVIWGTDLQSTVGIKFTLKQLEMVQLAPYEYSVIIGLLLSDGWLVKRSKNVPLGFAQSASHSEYFWFVFCSLSHYCSSFPIVRNRSRFGKETIGLEFKTRSMACLTKLRELFYPNGIKIIPQNIYELLTPIALAHMIMGDGAVRSHGLIICTDSYTVQDVVRLMNVLMIRYRLDCTCRFYSTTQPRIYIIQHSMPSLLNIVYPYMHPSMLYKLTSSLSIPSKHQKIEVFDLEEKTTITYNSIGEAAKALNCLHTVIVNYFTRNQKKPYKGRYTFKKIN